jgi:drug/metabolite transporter (DMT)-like permease
MRNERDERHVQQVQTVIAAVTATAVASILTNLSFDTRRPTDDVALFLFLISLPFLAMAYALLGHRRFPFLIIANRYYNLLLSVGYLTSAAGTCYMLLHVDGRLVPVFLISVFAAIALFILAYNRADRALAAEQPAEEPAESKPGE